MPRCLFKGKINSFCVLRYMLKKGLISSIMLALCMSGNAYGQQTPCQTVDQILATASTIRNIQGDAKNQNYSVNIQRLDRLSESISLASVIPQNQSQSLSNEVAAMFGYLAAVREGVAGARSGYDTYAKEALDKGITPEFTLAINSLGAFWECRPDPVEFDTDGTISSDRAVRTRPSDEKAEKGTAQFRKPGSRALVSTERSNSGVLQKMQLDQGLILKGDRLTYILIFGVFALFSLIFYGQKRARVFKEREARRLLNKAVQVRYEKKDYKMYVVDISMSGAKIQHSDVIHKLGKLSIFLNGDWHAGNVKWHNSAFAGVKFKKPVDNETVVSAVEG